MARNKDRSIPRIYVRRYRDNGQVTAYVDWSDGSRTEGSVNKVDLGPNRLSAFTFGTHMHLLFRHAKRDLGLSTQREVW